MGVMALFQLHFLQNACFLVRMAPGRGHLCCIDTFLVLFQFLLFQLPIEEKIEIIAKEIYGADGIDVKPEAQEQIDRYRKQVKCQFLTSFMNS